MSVKIKIKDFGIATITNGKWKANRMTKLLLLGFDMERLHDEVGYSPFPDLSIAEMAVKELSGDILEVTDVPKYDPDVIY